MSHVWDGDEVGAFAGQQALLFSLGAHSCQIGIDAEEKPRAVVTGSVYVRYSQPTELVQPNRINLSPALDPPPLLTVSSQIFFHIILCI